MTCEVCQTENATVHLTQIISGKMQKIDLCEKCAKEKGVADPAGFSLADMLLGLGAADEIKSNGAEDLVCPQCGFTQPDFKKTGRLGCPQCYVTFAEGLGVILKDMHKGIFHKGKIPSRAARAQEYTGTRNCAGCARCGAFASIYSLSRSAFFTIRYSSRFKLLIACSR